MCERHEQRQRAGEPYLSEALWSRISEHMTIHEWCKAAGTCKTSHNVPLKWARLSRQQPLEAWAFILKRSGKAVGFEIDLDAASDGQERAMLLMQRMHDFESAFRDVKELKISGDYCALNKGAQLSQHMALASMAVSFKSLQVLHLDCRLAVMPSFQSVRHLLVEQPDMLPTIMVIGNHNALPLLETLSLTSTDMRGSPLRDCILDCRAHTHLQHVHLANFAPTEYHFGDGCKVHGKWLDTKKEFAKFADWAGAEIWYHAAVKSMTVQRPFASCRQPGWEQLMTIISRKLEFVKLGFSMVGSESSPMGMLPVERAALARTERVHLSGRLGCHVAVANGRPLGWKYLKIVSMEEVSLDFRGNAGFWPGLESFYIFCKVFAGPSCIELTQAQHRSGKAIYYGGSRHKWWLSSFDGHNERACSRFDLTMQCGCQACPSCLHRAGKLPQGSIVPKDCSSYRLAH